jgi:MFS family permease
MFNWYKELKSQERRTFWACFGGFGLDGMDFQIYTFVIPALMAIWKLSPGDAGLIATVALLVSAFGGWITGVLSDRFGRVLMLQITIAWFAFFTFLQGLSPGFLWLLITRGLQGLGFGGEWAAGSVLMGEVIRREHRGKAVGAVQSSWAVGWGVAALLATLFFQTIPREYAWRALFFVGVLPALFIFFIRRAVPEPEIFRDTKVASNRESGILAIFRLDLLRRTLLGSLLAVGAQGGYYAITTWLPTFLQKERGLTILKSGYYTTVIIVGSFVGYLVSAYLSDRLGRRANFVLFAVPLGFFASGVFSGMGAFYTELFPTEVRGSAQGFCYNFGRGVAAVFPYLVGLLAARLPLGQAIGTYAGAAYLLMVFAALALPETRGRDLRSVR